MRVLTRQTRGRLVAALALTAGMVLAAVVPGAYGQEAGETEPRLAEETLVAAEAAVQEELERAEQLLQELRALEIDRDELQELLREVLDWDVGEVRGRLERSLAFDQERMHRGVREARAALERVRQHGMVTPRAPRAPRPPGAPWVGVGFDGDRAMVRLRGEMGVSPDRVLALAEEIDLSDEQRQRIRSLSREHRREEISRDAAIEVAELDLEELMAAGDEADLSAVESQMMEIAGLRVEGRVADLRLRRQVEGVLTPEQSEELEEMSPGAIFRLREGGSARFWIREQDDEEDGAAR